MIAETDEGSYPTCRNVWRQVKNGRQDRSRNRGRRSNSRHRPRRNPSLRSGLIIPYVLALSGRIIPYVLVINGRIRIGCISD
ncbi:hypothetical protein AVEN_29803-1 [Araneus ventricosus]|uniref:Uncharacterized protein n=1 Tax=Araneus ventricosus TaxID=182803 RepID=A0A4Y2GHV1_ARAVE|nr:hypothetical protein AVEN_29803-1 [Araneus ventricosus]